MLYVVDTSSFIVMGHYFPDRFPTFWRDLDALVANGSVISVSEVLKELNNYATRPHLAAWLKKNKQLFSSPSSIETQNVAKIFSVKVPVFAEAQGHIRGQTGCGSVGDSTSDGAQRMRRH